ncbi:uncharacterized protein LOC118203004 [Stegodyphus dumicola]|uniref:uncharacterized protein LOC118203004 n=1 Tax=Stegodyphus dumicola TaxID=202533 RepID=UPI0015ABE8BB|nr:uncharacterized protein LOC118203004 [Stegodyphus dumicola]
MKYLQGYKWGLNPHIQKLLYTTVTEKMVSYAAAVWANPMQGQKIKHLSSIERPFTLNITRAYCTTASDEIIVLAGLLPLHIRVEEEASRQLVKQLRRTATFAEDIFLPEEYEAQAPHLHIHPSQKGVGVRIRLNPTSTDSHVHTEIYTDGSKTDNNTGSAFIVLQDQSNIYQWKGQLRTNSVFQGEAVAIAHAISYLQEQQITPAVIKTDSQSSLYAINNPEHYYPIIQQIQQDLRDHPEIHISLEWIKAHVGHYGNELADRLAKEAANGQAYEQINIPWPISHLKRSLRLKSIGQFQEE